MRLIDADALMNHIKDVPTWQQDCDEYYWVATKYPHGMYDPEDIVSSIENTPTIDAVEVVRCKDCVGKNYWYKTETGIDVCGLSGLYVVEDRDFCSYGEMKDDDREL